MGFPRFFRNHWFTRYFRKSYWFQRYVNWQMIKFFLLENREWDWTYLLKVMEKKFTYMGLYFAKRGVSEENKKKAHACWELRKAVKDINNYEDNAYIKKTKLFIERYGFEYTLKMKSEKITEGSHKGMYTCDFTTIYPIDFPEEKKEEAEEYYHSINLSDGMYKEALDRFTKLMTHHLEHLWD